MDIFAGYRILGWQFFSHLKNIVASMVSIENFVILIVWSFFPDRYYFPFYLFFSGCFQDFVFVFISQEFSYIFLGVDLFGVFQFQFCLVSLNCMFMSRHKWESFSHYFFECFFQLYFLLCFLNSDNIETQSFVIVLQVPEALHFFPLS